MTTATKTEIYQEFTWQAVKSLAKKVGVPFYSDSSYKKDEGVGLQAGRWDKTKIQVEGFERSYGGNQYTIEKVWKLSQENFFLKFKLYALENGIEYVVSEDKRYIQIVKGGK